ncbi:hypothetical protein BGZ99_007310 [Dissophora globulifera]|uniref:RlpA-like protein double-psi beta-barrel domain-containing protein n=1 Tax=Dissophora globulifera TaxID=979702 RepID=A0A9P6RE68_9FUNG|nr:hypothetical protein BGZ99_007310 [Dissophora globulifera]
MVKFTASIVLLAIAALSSAAPVTQEAAAPSADPEIQAADVFSSSVKYDGKATWFTDSYGSCNINWNGNDEPIVALNAHQMGAQSWGNPACGREVQIINKSNGKTVQARIVDKCPGDECAFGSLDLSPAAFKQIGDLSTGILNIEWHYV